MDLEHNENIQTYLDTVCSQIKWRDMHAQIRMELLSHISELVEEYEQAGTPREDAVIQTLNHMGDARELGRNLHHIHKPRTEWSIVALVVFFLGLGLFTLYSLEVNGLLMAEASSLFIRSIIFTLAGVLIAVGVNFFNYQNLKSLSWYLYIGTLLVWLYILWQGPLYMGKPYLHLGFISIDFVEAAPFFLAIAIAGIFADWDWHQPNYLLKAFTMLMIPVILALMSPSITAAFLYALVFLIIMRVSGAKIKDIGLIILFLLTLTIFSVVTSPYRMARFLAFLNPRQDPQGIGYMVMQSIEAIRSAGFWGRGFDLPAGTLPSLHTDLIFTSIVYSFGWIAGLAVVVLATALFIRILRVARLVRDRYGRLLVSGLVGMLMIQFYWNILMTLGLAPLTGFSLPLVSYGGSQLIVQLVILGLVLSIYRRKDVVAAL
ncbi:FtsW/RodA/SpoVE family cell cycle protein [Desulfoscipio gibsoniae]|uniref:Bacterial cell division membrane protein n=1 Tax=Desulfoscipio gibsoniae DSM 7213 TaxID=767817 RepID=R4KBT6_9FIRM|nr:FtsW/RodA/SpoVE family cell cycle protein [Desulfoscipio gibsoniae]AGL00004.1 bacterial cell division membrane protein [Desulfoscipio gibsoniae DSM 7213]